MRAAPRPAASSWASKGQPDSSRRTDLRKGRAHGPVEPEIDYREFDRETADLERELAATQRYLRGELEARQAKEREDFRRQWGSIGTREQYQAESPERKRLGRHEAVLRSKWPDMDADEVKQQADELAQCEEAENKEKRRWNRDEAAKKLREKHAREIEAVEAGFAREWESFSQDRADTRRGLRTGRQGNRPGEDQFWIFSVAKTPVRGSYDVRDGKGRLPDRSIVVPISRHPRHASAKARRSCPI
jgi:hypothetical protein